MTKLEGVAARITTQWTLVEEGAVLNKVQWVACTGEAHSGPRVRQLVQDPRVVLAVGLELVCRSHLGNGAQIIRGADDIGEVGNLMSKIGKILLLNF